MVKTKIIATLGPSSSQADTIRKMMAAGLDVARLNFSHGTLQEQEGRIRIVRRLNTVYRRHLRILGDLEGYRIRIGVLKDHQPINLKKGQIFRLLQKNVVGEGDTASFDYEGPLDDIKKGQMIYIDDGTIALKVVLLMRRAVKTQVVVAGILKEHKGLNIPRASLHFRGLTKKDKTDIEFVGRHKLDFVAQSFVRTKKDVEAVREEVKGRWPACQVIAKIENREGIKNIDAIIEASDGVMIARGDMGISVPVYEVPMVQKAIIKKCNQRKKFVITATQMLEHMVDNRIPTRAEATDVANAVLDGTDYAMLSAETAVGRYPVEAVNMMNEIIKFTEESAGGLHRY